MAKITNGHSPGSQDATREAYRGRLASMFDRARPPEQRVETEEEKAAALEKLRRDIPDKGRLLYKIA